MGSIAMSIHPPTARNGHDTQHTGLAECPLCGSNITNQKAIEIARRQRARESEIIRAVEAKSVRDIAKVEAAKAAEVSKAVKAATALADTKLKALRANQD